MSDSVYPTYPSSLPCFQLLSYGITDAENIQSTDFGKGLVRNRLLPSGPSTVKASLKLSTAQLGTLESWFEHDVRWVGWFKSQVLTGLGLEEKLVRLMSRAYEKKAVGHGRWELGLQIQVRTPSIKDQMALYQDIYAMPVDAGTRLQLIIQERDV